MRPAIMDRLPPVRLLAVQVISARKQQATNSKRQYISVAMIRESRTHNHNINNAPDESSDIATEAAVAVGYKGRTQGMDSREQQQSTPAVKHGCSLFLSFDTQLLWATFPGRRCSKGMAQQGTPTHTPQQSARPSAFTHNGTCGTARHQGPPAHAADANNAKSTACSTCTGMHCARQLPCPPSC